MCICRETSFLKIATEGRTAIPYYVIFATKILNKIIRLFMAFLDVNVARYVNGNFF